MVGSREVVGNPQQMLMMAYHENLMTFGDQLRKVANQSQTVPREFAKAAVSEMKRSTEEMERYRAEARTVPGEMREGADTRQMIDQHLVAVKTHLRDLEELTRSGQQIRSQDVVAHLDAMSAGCQGRDCGAIFAGLMPAWSQGQAAGSEVRTEQQAMTRQQEAMNQQQAAMNQQHAMMSQMTQRMKTQDAELARDVEALKAADAEANPSKKLNLLTDIVTKMTEQRAQMTADMERMQMRFGGGASGYGAGGDTGLPSEPNPYQYVE
jgi:DNA repair exonuclease SbcCD ATPase subunit